MSGKLLFEYITSIRLQTTTRVRVSRISSQGISSAPRKAAKRGRKPRASSPSDFCRIYALVLLLQSVALVNYIKRDTIV